MEENQPQETKSGMNPALIVVAIVVIALVGWAFWSANNKKTDEKMEGMTMQKATSPTAMEQSTASTEPTSSSATETTDTSDVTVVDVEAGSFYFKPNEIHVKKGQKVKIVLTAKDMMHDFYIDELDVKMPVTNAGKTNTVEFTPTKAGTFEYYCSVGQHRKMGQVGKLIVE